jgi:hypothetical protein
MEQPVKSVRRLSQVPVKSVRRLSQVPGEPQAQAQLPHHARPRVPQSRTWPVRPWLRRYQSARASPRVRRFRLALPSRAGFRFPRERRYLPVRAPHCQWLFRPEPR